MALGAGWAGARSMTATAGPGISLMSEFVGLGYYAEIPAVIFDVERVGPSTGLPTRTQQGDLLQHGAAARTATPSTPCSSRARPKSASRMAIEAFDFAEHFQTPVFVMTDLDLGMNNWMADPFAYPDKPIQRGKVLTAEDLEQAGRLRALRGCGWRRRRLSHASGNQSSRGILFHPRQRPQRQGAVHRARRRLHRQHGSAGAQVRMHAAARARARGQHGSRGRHRLRGRGHFRLRGARKLRPTQERIRHRRQLPATEGLPVHRTPAGFHSQPRAGVRGGPEPRRASCWA